ncbi:MAG: pentapeptide repeat-containing protein [Paludibacter sp.]
MLTTKMIGNKIAEARKKKNISQAQLAQQLFISSQAVGKWERGESMPDIITLNRLAEILEVDLNYFSEGFQAAGDETALKMTDGIDTKQQTLQEEASLSRSQEQQMLTNFSGSNLPESDFAGVTARKGKFSGSALRGSDFSGADLTGSTYMGSDVRGADFSGADLTGSSFKASDMREANFDSANLTNSRFYALDLADASFNKSILVSTEFKAVGLEGAKFIDVKLIDVKLIVNDLRKTVFERCIFNGVDFKHSDLRGLCLDGQTFIGVKFDGTALNDVTFRGATLKNVSFLATRALTNKYYRALKTICFDGAMMDKLTYATLKGMGEVDLSRVIVV